MNNHPTVPSISIVIPVRNEQEFIKQNLEAIFNQDYPAGQIEILVIDGDSSDGTQEIVKSLQAFHPNLKLINNPAIYTPHALNTGLRNATGDVIIILGGHSEISRNYVSSCIENLTTHNVAAVGGTIDTVGENYQAQAIALSMSSRFGVGDATFRVNAEKSQIVDTVVFGAYKRETIIRTGFFDEELIRNQDDEYNYRIRAMGGALYFSPNIKSRYYSRSSLSKLFKQYYQYGLYKVRIMQKHPRQMRLRQFVPAIFVAALLSGGILMPLRHWLRKVWLTLVGIYALVNCIASIGVALRSSWRYFPLLPVAFFTLHFSYGLGFIHGIIRFRGHWKQIINEQ